MPTPSERDVLRFYQDAEFNGVPFPVAAMSVQLSRDLVEHKYPYRDVALIEDMGRGSNVFKFTIPFRNGIAKHEYLYPTGWRDFLKACAGGKEGILAHPEMGIVPVKVRSVQTTYDVNKRDGVDVEAEFVETLVRSDQTALLFGSESPIGAAFAAAIDFDSAIADGGYKLVYPASVKPDLLSAMKALNGLLAQISLGIGNLASTFDGILGGIDEMIQTLESENNPALAAAIQAATAAYAATLHVAQTATGGGREVSQAVIVRDANISAAAGGLGQSLPDFLKLNPALGTETSLRAGTQVLIYV